MHGRTYISEAAVSGAHHQKRGPQLHATVIDVELGVSRQRIAHNGIPTEVGQGVARVAEVVSAELARPPGFENVSSRVARPEDMSGPDRTARLGALQCHERHSGGKRPYQAGAQAAGRRVELLQPLLQRLLNRMLKVPGGSLAVEVPVRLKQVQHPLFDDIASDTRCQVSPGPPPLRRLVYGATRSTH